MTPPREQCCNTTSGCDFGTCDVLHEVLYIPGGAGFPSTVWLNPFLKTKTQLICQILPFIALLFLVGSHNLYTSFLSTFDTKVLRSRWPRSLPRIPVLAKTLWTKTGSKSTSTVGYNLPSWLKMVFFLMARIVLASGQLPSTKLYIDNISHQTGERPEYDHLQQCRLVEDIVSSLEGQVRTLLMVQKSCTNWDV